MQSPHRKYALHMANLFCFTVSAKPLNCNVGGSIRSSRSGRIFGQGRGSCSPHRQLKHREVNGFILTTTLSENRMKFRYMECECDVYFGVSSCSPAFGVATHPVPCSGRLLPLWRGSTRFTLAELGLAQPRLAQRVQNPRGLVYLQPTSGLAQPQSHLSTSRVSFSFNRHDQISIVHVHLIKG